MLPTRDLVSILAILLGGSPLLADAQDCNALLTHGLRNIQRSSNVQTLIATKYANHCHKDFSRLEERIIANIEVEVFEVGGGNAGLDLQDRAERLTEWCRTNAETANSYSMAAQESQQFYSETVKAWDSCNRLATSAVQITPTISPDGSQVDISVRHSGSSEVGPELYEPTVKGYRLTLERLPAAMQAQKDNGLPVTLAPQSVQYQFQREPAIERTRDGTNYLYTPAGTISILTAGEDLQINFPEVWDPTLPVAAASRIEQEIALLQATLVPVGTVLPWAGNLEALPPNWKLANGDEVLKSEFPVLWTNIGNAWGPETGISFRLPDLRGRFLRGVDGGAGLDPETDREVGSSQAEGFAVHDHGLIVGAKAPEIGGSGSLERHDLAVRRGSERQMSCQIGGPVCGVERGGAETRPDNSAVYYIIRVR